MEGKKAMEGEINKLKHELDAVAQQMTLALESGNSAYQFRSFFEIFTCLL